MVEMSLAGIAIDASNRKPIVLLRDPSGLRQVPIWIDNDQAHNIVAGIKQNNNEESFGHDLMIAILQAGNLSIDRIIISSFKRHSFQAILQLLPINNANCSSHVSPIVKPQYMEKAIRK